MSTISARDEASAGNATRTASARWALATLSLSMLLSSLGISIANVALPTLAEAFDASFQQVQWVVLSYLLTITILVVGCGRLGDLAGRRRLLLAGFVLFTAASALCGAAPTLWLLIAARAAQGVGAAFMMALTMAFVGETVPKSKIGSAMGLLGTMSAIGTALGPSLGGVLISGFGWRAIFFVNVPLGLVTLFLARHLPADRQGPEIQRPRFDHVGTLLLAVTLAAYALAMTTVLGSFGPLNVALLSAAGLGAGLFVLAESKTAAPLIRLAMFRNPTLSASLAMSVLVSTVMMATLVVGPFYLSLTLGLNAALVGLVVSVGPLVVALTGVPAGRMVDRFGAQRITVVGLIGIAAGCSALSMIPPAFGVPGYIAPLVVTTGGYAVFQTANNTAVMMDVPQDRRGVISGMLNLARNLGLVTGASAMGAVFALGSATVDITSIDPEAVAAGMRTTFAVAAVLILVGLIIAIGSGTVARRPSQPKDRT
jgi:EmrB/QacA subfamily drug resistance transporter